MINANELRIGNMVLDDEDMVVKIEALKSKKYNDWNGGDDYETIFEKNGESGWASLVFGIPLNEDWLLKFGFEQDEYKAYWYKQDLFYIRIEEGKLIYDHPFHPVDLQFVHQLQNLYFALTGTELELKK